MRPITKRKVQRGLPWCSALVVLAAGWAWGQTPASESSFQDLQQTLQQAIAQISSQPHNWTEFDYVMTARVRLLLFWAAKDDVGGGYIREGASPGNGSADMYQIVMGSDPAKTPMAINRWGAAWELSRHAGPESGSLDTNTFVGFMKVSKGTSVAEMQKEFAHEKQGQSFLFSTIVNQAGLRSNFAKEVPFESDRDFTIHQLDQAAPFMFNRLADSQGKLRSVDASAVQQCGRPQGFLSTVAELIGDTLRGTTAPKPLCYFYNGQRYTLSAERATPVAEETVQVHLDSKGLDSKGPDPSGLDQNGAHEAAAVQEPDLQQGLSYTRVYHNLLRVHFDNLNETTRKRSNFDLLIGTQGALRGVPVRITYQPNWWFQVILNLKAAEASGREAASN